MKLTLSLLLSLFLTVISLAQNVNKRVNIEGKIADSTNKRPLSQVSISLLEKINQKQKRVVLTDSLGHFLFNDIPSKPYVIEINSVGYQRKSFSINPENKTLDVGVIPMIPKTVALDEIVVKSSVIKPVIKQESDRLTYDVQADPSNNGNSVLDMLRKVPLVSVDANDNIKLRGNENYKILINGKPSSLIAQNPADVFKSMPASNILKIEVITTPPAKYDAEGLAGIINIITKKSIGDGYNGNISTRYNNVRGAATNLNATIKKGKWGIGGYTGYNNGNTLTNDNGYSIQSYQAPVTTLSQNGTNQSKDNNVYGNLELSYELDSLDLFRLQYEGNRYHNDKNEWQFSNLFDIQQNKLQSFGLNTQGDFTYWGNDLSMDYEHGFEKNKEQLLTFSYKYVNNSRRQNNSSQYSQTLDYSNPDYNQFNHLTIKEHTAQVDFVYPVKSITIEAGGKAIFRDNNSNYLYDTLNQASKVYFGVGSQTDMFTYQQNVYSIYNSYGWKKGKQSAKAGIRVERTTIQADFISTGSPVSQDYYNVVPSISTQRKFGKSNSISLGYSERIQRPSIWQINPFIDKSNPQVYSYGNPNLDPIINHSFSLDYSNFSKGNITLGLSYSFANNTIQNITTVGADTITRNTFQNVGKDKRLGLNLNTNYPITKTTHININAQILHVWLKGTADGIFYENEGTQGFCFLTFSQDFKNNWHFSIDGGYDSRYVLLQGSDNEYYHFNLGGNKDLWNKKVNIAFNINNPFTQYIKFDNHKYTAAFTQYDYQYQHWRSFNVSVRYKFGKLDSEIKKNKRGITNDDTGGQGH